MRKAIWPAMVLGVVSGGLDFFGIGPSGLAAVFSLAAFCFFISAWIAGIWELKANPPSPRAVGLFVAAFALLTLLLSVIDISYQMIWAVSVGSALVLLPLALIYGRIGPVQRYRRARRTQIEGHG